MDEPTAAPGGPTTGMTFVEAARAPLRKYSVFSGRSSRREFWSFGLAATIVLCGVIGLAFVALVVAEFASDFAAVTAVFLAVAVVLLVVYIGAFVAVVIPWLAVCVRRLHDTDRSGVWLLIALFVPFAAWVLLFFFATAGNPGANKYGPNPYGDSDDPTVAPPGT